MNNGNRYGNKHKYIYKDNNNANDNDKYKRWEIRIRMQNEILYKNNNNNNVYIVCIKIKAIWQKRHTHTYFSQYCFPWKILPKECYGTSVYTQCHFTNALYQAITI